jgi:hypothetical protein
LQIHNEVLAIALVCGFAVFFALMFVVGFVCGHQAGQAGCCKLANTNQSAPALDIPSVPVRRQEQNLELKENVAYETIHST